MPYSPGLRRPRRYPGYEDGLPFNANGVVPKHRRFGLPCSGSVAIPRTNHHVAHSAGFVNPRSTIPELGHGTTPSGLFIWLAFTRGSAPAAQPRALWQNPVGIPGGGFSNVFPHLRHLRITRSPAPSSHPHWRPSTSVRSSPLPQHQRCAQYQPGVQPQEMVH